MYHTTGLTRDRIVDVCAMIHSATSGEKQVWPPILGLFKSVVTTLTYLRRNRVQAELAENYEVSQPTISRAITAITPLVSRVLDQYVPTAEQLDEQTQYIVDGTLLPCWSWSAHPDLYSGKHKTTGMNVQVACTLSGDLAWVSDPVAGRHHDNYGFKKSGVLVTLEPSNWIGDSAYVGNNMITHIKKPPYRQLLDWEKEFNRQVSKMRWIIEQAIANLKTWRILHTDYRRPIATFAATLSTVVALYFYAAS